METVFHNDPFCVLDAIFKAQWPEKQYVARWVGGIEDEHGKEAYGVTEFSESGVPIISISAQLDVIDAIEIFAHELAHAAVGIESEHGAEWEAAFELLHARYMERVAHE